MYTHINVIKYSSIGFCDFYLVKLRQLNCTMAKFNWISDKILLQRIFLLGLGGIIARVVLNGYLDYNNQVR